MNKKLFGILSSLLFAFLVTSNANAFSVGIGIAEWDVDGSGTENVQGVNDNTGTHSETISGVPSIFIESEPNNGWVFGLDFIPVGAEFISSSKTQTNVTTAAGATESKTQKVEGDLDNHLTFYVEKEVAPGIYLKGGVISVDVTSNESIGTGSEYGNDTIYGWTGGLGYKHDMGSMFIKAELTYNEYETIELSSSNTTNSVEGDIDATTGKIAVGYKF